MTTTTSASDVLAKHFNDGPGTFTFTLRPGLKEDFEFLVEANGVMVGDVINTAIEEYIQKRTET